MENPAFSGQTPFCLQSQEPRLFFRLIRLGLPVGKAMCLAGSCIVTQKGTWILDTFLDRPPEEGQEAFGTKSGSFLVSLASISTGYVVGQPNFTCRRCC